MKEVDILPQQDLQSKTAPGANRDQVTGGETSCTGLSVGILSLKIDYNRSPSVGKTSTFSGHTLIGCNCLKEIHCRALL